MPLVKEQILNLVGSLPEDVTIEDVMYELYVLSKVEKGLKDSREGRVTPHEEVMKRYT